MLNRWNEEPDYWKKIVARNNDADIWIPYEDRKRKLKPHEDHFRTSNLLHNLAVTDVYCVLYPHKLEDGAPVMTGWDRGKDSKPYMEVYYDAQVKLFGEQFFVEVERGNHPILTDDQKRRAKREYFEKSLNQKLDNYRTYFHRHPEQKARLLMTFEDWSSGSYDAHASEEVFADALELVQRYGLGTKVLIARHRDVIGDRDQTPGEIHNEVLGNPLGEVWLSSENPETYVSIQSVLRQGVYK